MDIKQEKEIVLKFLNMVWFDINDQKEDNYLGNLNHLDQAIGLVKGYQKDRKGVRKIEEPETLPDADQGIDGAECDT